MTESAARTRPEAELHFEDNVSEQVRESKTHLMCLQLSFDNIEVIFDFVNM